MGSVLVSCSLVCLCRTDWADVILVCSSLVVWVYICRPLYWRICSLIICKWRYLAGFRAVNWRGYRTWGSTGKEVERSSFWIEGRVFQIPSACRCCDICGIISASYMATFQVVVHHLLCSYRHDDHFYHRRHSFWVADSGMELGFDHPAVACGWMPYSFTSKFPIVIYFYEELGMIHSIFSFFHPDCS